MPYDVFLSYCSDDWDWVETFALRLKSYGLSVWLDRWCVNPGDLIADKINQGLAESPTAIAVYSRASTEARWVAAETAAVISPFLAAQAFPGQRKRLIPVKIEECTIPPLQGALNFVDFTGIVSGDVTAFEKQVRLLLRSFPDRLSVSLREPTGVPLVVASMKAEEVESLFDGTAFQGYPQVWQGRFEALAQALIQSLGLAVDLRTHLLAHYGEKREDWCPFGVQRTIRQVVQARVDGLNAEADPLSSVPIALELWSEEFFSDKDSLRRRTAYRLRQGCYLMIDPLALFHPRIVDTLIRSQLLSNDAVTVLSTSPISSHLFDAFRAVEQVFERELDLLFLRFKEVDPQCVLGVDDPDSLELWLKTQLPLAVGRLKKIVPSKPTLQKFLREVDVQTTGVAGLVTGAGTELANP